MLARKRNIFRYYTPITQQPWYYTRQGRLEALLYPVGFVLIFALCWWLFG
jgi:hypothetical protein